MSMLTKLLTPLLVLLSATLWAQAHLEVPPSDAPAVPVPDNAAIMRELKGMPPAAPGDNETTMEDLRPRKARLEELGDACIARWRWRRSRRRRRTSTGAS